MSRTHVAPHVFETKGRAYAGNSPYSLKKEEGGRHTPFHSRMLGAVSSVSALGGGGSDAASASYARAADDGPNLISMNVTVPKQTQGATFGEKVNTGLHAPGLTRFRLFGTLLPN